LSAFPSGIIGNILIGGIGATANSLFNQVAVTNPSINSSTTMNSLFWGSLGGGIGGLGLKLGIGLYNPYSSRYWTPVIPYFYGSNIPLIPMYQSLGGIIGMFLGTVVGI